MSSAALLLRSREKLRGAAGQDGKAGRAGNPGKAGEPGLRWRGSFRFGETYQPGDVVESEGSAYVAVAVTARKPPDPDWDLLAAKGEAGASGRGYIRGGGGSAAGGAPSGPAGGDLSGTYPNPSVTDDSHSHTGATLPATADLEAVLTAGNDGGALGIVNAGEIRALEDAGFLGGSIETQDGDSAFLIGGAVSFTAGVSAAGNTGGELSAGGGNDSTNAGGLLALRAGNGIAPGASGGYVQVFAGAGEAAGTGGTGYFAGGDVGGDLGARIVLAGASSGTPGKVGIRTDDDTGDAGDLLTADGGGTATWVPSSSQPLDATLTALAAANWAANAVPIGTGADTLAQTAFAASTFPARASTGNLVAKTITDFGLSLVDDAAASNARTTLGLGTAAVAATGDFDPAGTGAAAAAASIAKTFLDAKGDLISASADNTPALLTVGGNDTILMADSAAAAGLKWVASQTPTTQAFSDAAAQGSADTYARGDHLHGLPALGTTAAAVGTSAGGSATTPSKSDHVHATGAGTPSTQAFGDAAATGTGPAAAMTDHKHAMPAAPIGDHTHAATGTGASGGGSAVIPVTLKLPTGASISLTTTEGYVGEDTTTQHVQYYDSQRQRIIGTVGWVPYAFPPGYAANASVATSTTLAAAGGSVACPVYVPGHMLLQALQYRQGDASLLRTAEWQLYLQYLNNANGGENTLAAVTGATGTDSLTAGGASTRTSAVTSPPIYLAPGLYWLVFRNTHATNSFAIQGPGAGTMQNDLMQTKTLASALGSTLDFVAATWTKVGSTPLALILQGRVFGQTTAF